MLSNQEAGGNLPLKRGRGRPRGRASKQSSSSLVDNDHDSRRMTRSRSRSRGRIPATVQQQRENNEGTGYGPSARIESSPSSSFRGSSALVYKTDTCSTMMSSRILQSPRPQSQQEASSFSSGRVLGSESPLPSYPVYNTTNAPRRLPLPVPIPAPKKLSSTVPFGLPMFSFLSTPSSANQAFRKRPQESIPPFNYGKRHNSSTDELPGCHFQTTPNQTNKDAQTNAKSNQMIVSPLNRLYNETNANQTPQHSSFSQCNMQSSYPDIEIIPVSTNGNSDFDEESHSTAPGNSRRVQINSKGTGDATLPLTPYVDARPAQRIPFPIRKEYSVSTSLRSSLGHLQKQARSTTGKEANQETGKSTSMQLNENVTITPVINITDDEDDDCVSQSKTMYASVSVAGDEVDVGNSEEAVVDQVSESRPEHAPATPAPVVEMSLNENCNQGIISDVPVRPVMGRNNATKNGSYDGDDEEEEEYHDTLEELDEQHVPTKPLVEQDEEIFKKKKNWCTIV